MFDTALKQILERLDASFDDLKNQIHLGNLKLMYIGLMTIMLNLC